MPLPNALLPHKTLRRQTALLLLGGLLCLAPGIGNAQKKDQSDALKEVRDKITKTSARAEKLAQEEDGVATEIRALSETLVTAAGKIQETESKAYDAEDRLKQLNEQEIALQKSLDARAVQMAKTLAAMQRLSQQPAELVAYRPDKAVNRLRSAGLLQTLLPELEKRAKIIQQDMENLESLRRDITREREELQNLLATLTQEQLEMNQLLDKRRQQRQALRDATQEERRKLKKFAAEADSLQDLIAKIEQEARERADAAREAARRLAEKPTAKKSAPTLSVGQKPQRSSKAGGNFQSAKGTMPLPAQGVIRKSFGQRTPEGAAASGITIHTLPRAMVVSPYEGRIVFAGNFRTYGQMLIIAHGQEYHTLLAGITRLDAEVGQWVLKGEPIGQMAATTQTRAVNASSDLGQNLYVELRRMGKPINPLPYIVARDRKVL